ncbi:hypothetical protein [Mastigocoleus testarum]|uniref:hypothetical protein n=1 Tax=Mastigocoleus testarum TaxID=996925 RepID=UPI00137A8383|nr:hypothetical protein [Mastigocoleus testarum]
MDFNSLSVTVQAIVALAFAVDADQQSEIKTNKKEKIWAADATQKFWCCPVLCPY